MFFQEEIESEIAVGMGAMESKLGSAAADR